MPTLPLSEFPIRDQPFHIVKRALSFIQLCRGSWIIPEAISLLTAASNVNNAFCFAGCLHYFGYEIQSKPYLTYGQLGPDGSLVKEVPIDIPHPALLHDFVVSQDHAIFVVGPLNFDIKVGGNCGF